MTAQEHAVRAGRFGGSDPRERTRKRPSFVQRFSRHRAGSVGAAVVVVFIVAGAVGPVVAPHDPIAANTAIRLQTPSPDHWLGTDGLGRDVLSRLLYGAGISLRVSFAVVVFGIVLGVPFGALSGYLGGAFDLITQRVIDAIQAFPGILLLILIFALIGPSLELAVLGLGVLSVPGYARLIRSGVLQLKQFPYVDAARTIGCGEARILVRHILPNAVTPIIVQASLQAAGALVLLAGLSFLGIGAQPPTPEWGVMLTDGRTYLRSSPHLVLFPGLAISIVVLGLNLVGDALRDALDPRSKSAGG